MNRTAVKKVIVALRSGEYKKCTYQLAKKKKGEDAYGAFCVWGVITDQYAETFGINRGTDEYKKLFEDAVGIYAMPRLPVRKWVGFPHSIYQELIRLNDSGRASFSRIADYLEAAVKEESDAKRKARKTPKA